MPGLFPVDPRGSKAMERHRNHEGHGGEGQQHSTFQADYCKRQGLCWEVQEVDTDQGSFHHMGDIATPKKVPGKITGFGAHVRLQRQASCSNKSLQWTECDAESATALSVLRWQEDNGYCVPWLVFLGLVCSSFASLTFLFFFFIRSLLNQVRYWLEKFIFSAYTGFYSRIGLR